MSLKLFLSSRYYSLTIMIVVIAFANLNKSVVSQLSDYEYRKMQIIIDLPAKNHLEKYLTALEKVVGFANSHKVYVDLNLCFGMFLINVNLRGVMPLREDRLPPRIKLRLDYIMKATDDIMNYFSSMVEEYIPPINQSEQSGARIQLNFINKEVWLHHLQMFGIDLLNQTKFYTWKELRQVYLRWPKYRKKVFDFGNNYSPNPAESDNCLTLLAENPVNHNIVLTHCQIPSTCAQTIVNGTDYGYGITHRLLFLLMARFSRGCAIFSAAKDKRLIDKLCAKMYNEAEYIAHNDFLLPDLIMEHIALCSLEGHAQFLQRLWIDDLLEYQTIFGCFNLTRPDDDNTDKHNPREEVSWRFMIPDQMIMGESCHGHTTAVAGIMLASIVRYIIENHY